MCCWRFRRPAVVGETRFSRVWAKHHIVVCTLSSLTDLAEGRVTISDLCELDIDDLLGRESIEPNLILLAKNITDRVVLVTGAGGSIGSELCRQIVKLQPIKLILVEINEYALYTIHTELENINKLLDSNEKIMIVPLLTTVQDRKRMSDIMETWQPDTVYHAAAYKHVPLVEYNLIAGVENNVFGTLNTAQIAINKGVSSFILVSTDKAVRPTSVMGASKRLSEICLQALFDFYSKKSKTKLSMVRFGNVMDSSGSVIPRFRKQISDGGPITITHPDISRYFMTIPEAAQLVIQAGAMAKGGEVFVLDMGEPVKIIDLAQRMIELSGLSIQNDNNLEGDIEITITGLRPGEKLYEELLIGENPQPTKHPKIQKANDQFIHWNKLENQLNCLKNLLSQNNVEEIIKLLQILVKDYNPNNEIVDWSYNEQKHNLINSNKS